MNAAHLLHYKGHRCAFIQQTQLASGVLCVPWISVYSAIQQGSVEVAHQGAYVSAGRLQPSVCACKLACTKLIQHA